MRCLYLLCVLLFRVCSSDDTYSAQAALSHARLAPPSSRARKVLAACALLSDDGDIWTARDALDSANVSSPPPAIALRVAGSLSRVGDWSGAAALAAAPSVADVVGAPVFAADADARPCALATLAGELDESTCAVPSLTRLLVDAALARERGDFAGAGRALRAASARAAAFVQPAAALKANQIRGTGGAENRTTREWCAAPLVLLEERLLAGARYSAVGIEAALGEWSWLWAPAMLNNARARNGNTDAANAGSPAPQGVSGPADICGVGAVHGTGGWADVARIALDAGAGRGTAALATWDAVAARVNSTLTSAHSDFAVSLFLRGFLLQEAGDLVSAVIVQRISRTALIDAAGGNKTLAEGARIYARSLLASSEALVALGQTARALKYLKSAREVASATFGDTHPFAVTVQGLLVRAKEEEAFSVARLGCAASSLVCAEKASAAAALALWPEYESAAAAWRVLPADARSHNVDFAAFAGAYSLAAFRSAPAVRASLTQLEAGVLHSLLGSFTSYDSLRVKPTDESNTFTVRGSLLLDAASQTARALIGHDDFSGAISYLSGAAAAATGVVSTLDANGTDDGAGDRPPMVELSIDESLLLPARSPGAAAAQIALDAAGLALAHAAVAARWHTTLSRTDANVSVTGKAGSSSREKWFRERGRHTAAAAEVVRFFGDGASTLAAAAGYSLTSAEPRLPEFSSSAARLPPVSSFSLAKSSGGGAKGGARSSGAGGVSTNQASCTAGDGAVQVASADAAPSRAPTIADTTAVFASRALAALGTQPSPETTAFVMRAAETLIRYGALAYDCTPDSSAQRLRVRCNSPPRTGVPEDFLKLFNVGGFEDYEKVDVLTPSGVSYLVALSEEIRAIKAAGSPWELVIASSDAQLARLRGPLAKRAQIGMLIAINTL